MAEYAMTSKHYMLVTNCDSDDLDSVASSDIAHHESVRQNSRLLALPGGKAALDCPGCG
jgi:hypothetical protein